MRNGRSPTVEAAYERNPAWWEENGGHDAPGGFDADGYDSHGWNARGEDRAGRSSSAYEAGSRGLQARLKDAEAVGQRLLIDLDRRIPRAVSMAVMAAVSDMLSARFPEAVHSGLDVPAGEPSILEGFNVLKEPYVGAYWPSSSDRQEYFTVIVERHPVNQRRLDPRNTWSATIMWQDASDADEDRILGKQSLDALMSEISERLALFRPGRSRHVVFIEDAGSDAASFGAMALRDYAELEAKGSAPGDAVSETLAETPADALAEFRSKGRRSPGFEAMIDKGLERHLAESRADRSAARPLIR